LVYNERKLVGGNDQWWFLNLDVIIVTFYLLGFL